MIFTGSCRRHYFDELVTSIQEAGQIKRGKAKPGRQHDLGNVDVQAIRKQTGLSQQQFALLIGVSVRTLQNWEQGRRTLQGPALALLKIFKNDSQHTFHALYA